MSGSDPAVTLKELPKLAEGTLPLFKSGVLGLMGPLAMGKALKSIYQWSFTPAGLLSLGAAQDPYHTAIIDDAGSITYSELHDQTNKLAQALYRTGVRERDKIGMLSRNHRGFLMTLCAHGRLGTDIVLFNTGASASQTRAVMKEQKIDLLFIDEEFIPLLPKGFDECPVIINWEENHDTAAAPLSDEEKERKAAAGYDVIEYASNVAEATESEDHAVRNPQWPTLTEVLRTSPGTEKIPGHPRRGRTIILTSGTTGTPKGARRPEPKTYLPASSIMSRIPLKHHRGYYVPAPMFHLWGFCQIQLGLALRATFILQRKFNPRDAVKLIEANRPDTIAIVPTQLRRLLEAVPENFSRGVRNIVACGEALPARVIRDTHEKFGQVLYNLYGSTEVSWASIAQPQELEAHPTTAGKAPMATTLKVVDEHGNDVPEGEVGRVFVGNDLLFDGYTRPGVDKENLHGLVSTGDLGYFKDGLFYLAGRSDDMIVSGGENVYPMEAEDVISDMPEVYEVAVHGVADPDFGQALACYVVLNEGESEEGFAEKAKLAVKAKLARHNVPRYFVFMDVLPRNAVGKIVPRELPKIDNGTDEEDAA
ncbi:AMP-binding protein [Corynebacterium variabile]|uniref:Acyl-CoA synthetases (AMP-forming)/AMP-acid ligases II n=1 Tax=Corynebacterium variabile TaxID=1727 RepID=A0A0X2NN00_9CORY|nr:AMP-binding protein [Corynebacterium variabile]MDN6240254.1 AMP-binding protein [Corynebacterium variabile]MDN6537251.1 AMP-binding protein [Corynebacterium variabile]MDN6660370.1 AMP-binding protein [Corynebacterium variabile]CUU66854.1 Acyl-CoA synthetases (AMP-forming)/AMP-acid ligases II [Corynebacterium variabile]